MTQLKKIRRISTGKQSTEEEQRRREDETFRCTRAQVHIM